MILVGRYINGIPLNGLEYLLDSENGEARTFESKEEAKMHLEMMGFTEDDISYLVFEECGQALDWSDES